MATTPAHVTVSGMLEMMLRMQGDLQRRFIGKHPSELDDSEKMEYIRTMHTALIKELGEALDETGWKPWASSNHMNVEAFRSEMVDSWHFFMNLMLVAGMTAEDLMGGYVAKNHVNHQRITEGYDGVTGKCPGCRRDYGDKGVKCTPTHAGPDGAGMGWCEVHGGIDTPVVSA